MIKLYLYDKNTLYFLREDVGHPQYLMKDMPTYLDFTLTPPPDYHSLYRWVDGHWIADDTAAN